MKKIIYLISFAISISLINAIPMQELIDSYDFDYISEQINAINLSYTYTTNQIVNLNLEIDVSENANYCFYIFLNSVSESSLFKKYCTSLVNGKNNKYIYLNTSMLKSENYSVSIIGEKNHITVLRKINIENIEIKGSSFNFSKPVYNQTHIFIGAEDLNQNISKINAYIIVENEKGKYHNAFIENNCVVIPFNITKTLSIEEILFNFQNSTYVYNTEYELNKSNYLILKSVDIDLNNINHDLYPENLVLNFNYTSYIEGEFHGKLVLKNYEKLYIYQPIEPIDIKKGVNTFSIPINNSFFWDREYDNLLLDTLILFNENYSISEKIEIELFNKDVEFEPERIDVAIENITYNSTSGKVNVTIKNNYENDLFGLVLETYVQNYTVLDEKIIERIEYGKSIEISFYLKKNESLIYLMIDPENKLAEIDETNNVITWPLIEIDKKDKCNKKNIFKSFTDCNEILNESIEIVNGLLNPKSKARHSSKKSANNEKSNLLEEEDIAVGKILDSSKPYNSSENNDEYENTNFDINREKNTFKSLESEIKSEKKNKSHFTKKQSSLTEDIETENESLRKPNYGILAYIALSIIGLFYILFINLKKD